MNNSFLSLQKHFKLSSKDFNTHFTIGPSRGFGEQVDCKIVIFFANASDGKYSNEVWSEPHTPCGRARLTRFARKDHAYSASRLPQKSENDCFAVKGTRNMTIYFMQTRDIFWDYSVLAKRKGCTI